jgi:hypothetical protein
LSTRVAPTPSFAHAPDTEGAAEDVAVAIDEALDEDAGAIEEALEDDLCAIAETTNDNADAIDEALEDDAGAIDEALDDDVDAADGALDGSELPAQAETRTIAIDEAKPGARFDMRDDQHTSPKGEWGLTTRARSRDALRRRALD